MNGHLRAVIVALMLAATAAAANAAEASQAEITFWQSVENSQNADELSAYLQVYPDGVFAGLAKIKIKNLGGTQVPTETTPPAANPAVTHPADTQTAAPAVGDLSDATITTSPAKVRVGQKLKISFSNLPTPAGRDLLVVVPAGSPDTMGATSSEGILAINYMTDSSVTDGTLQIGPFSPGKYEVRWLTTLYNNENRREVGARAGFEVGR